MARPRPRSRPTVHERRAHGGVARAPRRRPRGRSPRECPARRGRPSRAPRAGRWSPPSTPGGRSRTRASGSPIGRWPTSPANPRGAPDQPTAVDEPGADADRAGEVEQVLGCRRPAPWCSSASAAQSASLLTRARSCQPNASSTSSASEVPVMPRLGVHATVRSSSRDQARVRRRWRRPGAGRRRAAARRPRRPARPGPARPRRTSATGAGDPVPDRAGQVEDDRGDVLDVGLEADADGPATRQREPEARAAAVTAAHLLVARDRAGLLQVADDRADRGLGEAGAAGELGAGGRAVVAQRPQHALAASAAAGRPGSATDPVEVLERELVEVLERRRRAPRSPRRRAAASSSSSLPGLALGQRRHARARAAGPPRAPACTSGSARNARTFSRRIR